MFVFHHRHPLSRGHLICFLANYLLVGAPLFCAGIKVTLLKINWLMTFFTGTFFIKFIGEYFLLCPAGGTFTDKRCEVFELLKSWAVLGCSHFYYLLC